MRHCLISSTTVYATYRCWGLAHSNIALMHTCPCIAVRVCMLRWYRLVTVFTAVYETALSSYTVIVVHSQLCIAVSDCRVWGPTTGDVACV